MDMDKDYLKKLRKGDRAAWRAAFQALYPIGYTAANRYKRSLTADEIEDAVSESLEASVKLVKSVKEFDEVKLLVFRTAQNKAVSIVRKKLALKRNEGKIESLETIDEPVFLDGSPRELWELKDLIDVFLGNLEGRFRALVEDFALQGLTYKELSEKYDLPMGTVGVQISRAISKLRKSIEENPRVARELVLYLK